MKSVKIGECEYIVDEDTVTIMPVAEKRWQFRGLNMLKVPVEPCHQCNELWEENPLEPHHYRAHGPTKHVTFRPGGIVYENDDYDIWMALCVYEHNIGVENYTDRAWGCVHHKRKKRIDRTTGWGMLIMGSMVVSMSAIMMSPDAVGITIGVSLTIAVTMAAWTVDA